MNIEPVKNEFFMPNVAAAVAPAAGEVVQDPRSPIGIAKQVELSDAYSGENSHPQQDAPEEAVTMPDHSLKISVSKDKGVVIKIVNDKTEEVVTEIPSQELQRVRAELRRISGRLFNAQA